MHQDWIQDTRESEIEVEKEVRDWRYVPVRGGVGWSRQRKEKRRKTGKRRMWRKKQEAGKAGSQGAWVCLGGITRSLGFTGRGSFCTFAPPLGSVSCRIRVILPVEYRVEMWKDTLSPRRHGHSSNCPSWWAELGCVSPHTCPVVQTTNIHLHLDPVPTIKPEFKWGSRACSAEKDGSTRLGGAAGKIVHLYAPLFHQLTRCSSTNRSATAGVVRSSSPPRGPGGVTPTRASGNTRGPRHGL